MGGGQPIPAGLSCPPPRFLSSEWAMGSELLLMYFSTINGYVSQNKDTACWYTKTHFLNKQITGGGQHIPAGLPYPPLKILELAMDSELLKLVLQLLMGMFHKIQILK